MPSSQTQLALQMIAQLRLLDPSVSAEVGTPERKILDTVAQALYDDQIDLTALSTGLDVDGKYGSALDRFLTLFGFTRQSATFATGFATFSRPTASTSDIRVPAGTTVRATTGSSDAADASEIRFTTTYDVILPAGSTSVIAPIKANVAGTIGNVAAQRITEITGSPVFGITSVINENATSGGNDSESDAEFKTRFKNTVFRNLAGTQDQYLALAVATAFSTRANVIGPQSVYREYIQVPWVDDASSYDVNGDSTPDAGGGAAGQYTTALSTIPYAKDLWTDSTPSFLSNGNIGAATIFYRSGDDFLINTSDAARDVGDTHRQKITGIGPNPASGIWPNVTLLNVYTGDSADVSAVRPGDILLFEFNYLSEASRNVIGLITNAVDVYVDGGNEIQASTVTVRPTTATAFVDSSTSKYHYENFRRIGEPTVRPIIGNVFMPLFWQPVLDIPDQIQVGDVSYLKGVHYWPVEDVSNIGNTVRARSGIEWSTKINGKADTDSLGDPSGYTGKIITDNTLDPAGGQPIEIINYVYDKNIVDLQASLEGSKQITTDVLAHRATQRYFKLDVSVMYESGVNVPAVNEAIEASVDSYLRSLYFGSNVQLSDLLQAIHNVGGVDNVRWSSDIPSSADLTRVFETDANGKPLTDVSIERTQPGTASRHEIQSLYINGQPTAGTFTLTYGIDTTTALNYNASATDIQIALNALPGTSVTVTEDTRSTIGVTQPIRSFKIEWSTNGAQSDLVPAANFTGGPFVIDTDFFLRDHELARLPDVAYVPASGTPDTVPGLIIRPRAQNTFNSR